MIALPSIAFGGFSGSAKDVTARNHKGRSVLSVRSWPTGPATTAQVVRRGDLGKISRTYKTLSDSQMQGWERLANSATGRSVLGQKAKLTGHNLFVRLNANLAYIGEDIIYNAPETSFDLPTVQFEDIWVTPPAVLISGIEWPAENLRLVVKMSDAQSPGVSVGWAKTVIVAPNMTPDWGEVDVTTLYTNIMGVTPVPGLHYFVELYWIDANTGYTGVPLQIDVIASENTSKNGQVYNGPRVKLMKGVNLTTENNTFREFDLELSVGSAYVSLEALLYRNDYGHLGPAIIDPVPPVFSELYQGKRFGLLGRSSNLEQDERVIVTIFTCSWRPDPYDPDKAYKMEVKLPGGISLYEFEYEIFDTSVFVNKNGE